MSNILIPIEKLIYLSLVRFPVSEARCPSSMPTVSPLYHRNTGKVAPKVIPIEAMSCPLKA